jgi:hypothetical protein
MPSTRALQALVALALLAPFATPTLPGAAADVKLIALPKRDRVEIQLDVPGLTLIEEERTIPLAKGANDVVFAWANTAIDKSTIQFRCMSDPENVQVISVSYPPNENALTWQVSSPTAGPAKVRISYIIGGVDKSYEYRAEAANDEKKLTLWQYVQLHNRTPESFGEADMFAGYGERLERPIGANETRKILAAKFENVPITKTYTADLAQHGYLDPAKRQLKIPMHYVLKNDAANGLGRFPLQAGKARIFIADGKAEGEGTTAFLGEDWAAFAAKDDELKLFLGVAKDIVVTRTIERRDRKKTAGPLSDYDIVVKYEIENFKDQPVSIDLAESIANLRAEVLGDAPRAIEWVLGTDGSLKTPDALKSTSDRVLFHVDAPARGADQKAQKKTETLNIVLKNEW